MINKQWRTSKAEALAIGDSKSMTLTYEDRFLGKIEYTFSPANALYLVLEKTNMYSDEEVVKFIKERILFKARCVSDGGE